MRRALLLLVLVVVAGCGGDEEGTTATTATRTTTTPRPSLTQADAVIEAQSVAAQEAFRRDFSFPPADFATTCEPLASIDGRARYECRFRSPAGQCRGTAQIALLPDGSRQSRDVRIKCRGKSNI